MTDELKIAFAQMNQRVGDLDGNAAGDAGDAAQGGGGRRGLAAVPGAAAGRLSARGPGAEARVRPAYARMHRPAGRRDDRARTRDADRHDHRTKAAQTINAMLLADGGKVLGRTLKHELPNYGTFDEKRIFTPGPLPEPIEFKGVKLGVPICEDIWQEPVCAHLAELGAEMLLVPNGSPYELDKDDKPLPPRPRPRATDRPADRLPQPRRRPGRAGVRRLVLHRPPRRRARRAAVRLGRGAAGHRLGARRPRAGAA